METSNVTEVLITGEPGLNSKPLADYINGIVHILNGKVVNKKRLVCKVGNGDEYDTSDNAVHRIVMITKHIDRKHYPVKGKNDIIIVLGTEAYTKRVAAKSKLRHVGYFDFYIEYSSYNYDLTHELTPMVYIPVIYNPHDILYTVKGPRIHDVGLVCAKSVRRLALYSKLVENNKVNIVHVKGYGIKRDKILGKCKIILNVHHEVNRREVFEPLRCNRHVYNKQIVVSETSKFESDEAFSKCIFADYDNLYDTVIHTLADYDNVYQRIYGGWEPPVGQADEAFSRFKTYVESYCAGK